MTKLTIIPPKDSEKALKEIDRKFIAAHGNLCPRCWSANIEIQEWNADITSKFDHRQSFCSDCCRGFSAIMIPAGVVLYNDDDEDDSHATYERALRNLSEIN